MASPGHIVVFVVVSFIVVCNAGPLGPLPNVTSSDIGLKEGSCALGDVVYMPGDEFPGSTPCERCTCTGGSVQCEKQRCEPRPGCKALHRPDHCCPTYQCECEQEGRVYGNGEKLVDPADPCRVCYCQGGEVVCRRIACFVRDDCLPRLVPGRCCPEYDNCPLRGVTTIPGMVPSISSVSNIEDVGTSAVPSVPKENIKQEITIKEITPVSEIPVITDVKIKEILPSPSIEVAEYSSSKSPLIPREATSEKSVSNEVDTHSKPETPVVMEVSSSSSPMSVSSSSPDIATKLGEIKSTADSFPSKISLSTQDSINSEIYPSNIPSVVATMGSPSVSPEIIPIATTTKASMIEEEDASLFDHNPAFPPLPDDLSVLSNHEDDIVSDPNADNEHVLNGQEVVSVPSANPSTEAPIFKESSTMAKITPEATPVTTERAQEVSVDLSTIKVESTVSTENSVVKDNPMLNLRSAIPTEILNVPSLVKEDITGELDDVTEVTSSASDATGSIVTSTTTETNLKLEERSTEKPESTLQDKISSAADFDSTTYKAATTEFSSSSQNPQGQTTNSIAKSNVATEVTSQTELSSLPIETSDQNPQETSDNVEKNKAVSSAADSVTMELATTKILPTGSEVITVSSAIPPAVENHSVENVETTELILSSFGSSESTTDAVELIKISPETDKNAAIIRPTDGTKNSVLNDLINLVGDVASISDHTDGPELAQHVTGASSISDSEELIPVNAGYKSKNNNWNLNSITEIPLKSKNQTPVNKQKVVEIEDDESDSITDSPPPNDKVEPTTRRPIIDNVSADDMPENKTEKKDIEIITQSYVPTINKRPTKVVMKKNEKLASEEAIMLSTSSEITTEFGSTSQETATVDASEVNSSTEDENRTAEQSNTSSSTSVQ